MRVPSLVAVPNADTSLQQGLCHTKGSPVLSQALWGAGGVLDVAEVCALTDSRYILCCSFVTLPQLSTIKLTRGSKSVLTLSLALPHILGLPLFFLLFFASLCSPSPPDKPVIELVP